MFYAIICDAYRIENIKDGETREVLGLPYNLCPYKVAVLPLSNKLNEEAKKVFDSLIAQNIPSVFDVTGSIGKRYRRQDAIGTFYCITYDFNSLKDNCVTIRNRDTMKQDRIKISEISKYLGK
ncbi:MAG: His/Gly/Thr/Pro-type tRNA ligase C-terminal domain-containing protein [Mycoplasmoidaceae bacterium]|nr:His/Gly/Thr/Pro-type tRNA ligase C-terminal domain-containing protein [Mycoplasmoidaceae bacterium]